MVPYWVALPVPGAKRLRGGGGGSAVCLPSSHIKFPWRVAEDPARAPAEGVDPLSALSTLPNQGDTAAARRRPSRKGSQQNKEPAREREKHSVFQH